MALFTGNGSRGGQKDGKPQKVHLSFLKENLILGEIRKASSGGGEGGASSGTQEEQKAPEMAAGGLCTLRRKKGDP